MASEHNWQTVVSNGKISFETCEKCGLSRLSTLTGSHYFLRWSPVYAQCSSPYRLEPEPEPEPKEAT